MTVIEFAEKRYKECCDNEEYEDARYWAAYLDGARAQKDTWERLKAYEDAEAEGRLVVLPCKVGDTVYAIKRYGGKPIAIIEDKVQMIGVTSRTTRILLRAHHDHNQTFLFGKTVFLTREEAEAALRKEGAE